MSGNTDSALHVLTINYERPRLFENRQDAEAAFVQEAESRLAAGESVADFMEEDDSSCRICWHFDDVLALYFDVRIDSSEAEK